MRFASTCRTRNATVRPRRPVARSPFPQSQRTTAAQNHPTPRTARHLHWNLPMFDALSEKLQAALADVRQRGTLTEDDINKAMREIRLALLEADVNFKVVKSFTASDKERSRRSGAIGALNPR